MGSDEKKNPDVTEDKDDKDTEGHNIFATQDYYVQRTHERTAEVEREARQRERVKEAEQAKRNRR